VGHLAVAEDVSSTGILPTVSGMQSCEGAFRPLLRAKVRCFELPIRQMKPKIEGIPVRLVTYLAVLPPGILPLKHYSSLHSRAFRSADHSLWPNGNRHHDD
jgi:hypothetical protein